MEKKYAVLPADDAVQNWFEENIDKECSASSAIYKFRLWLESLQGKPKTDARWVKASEFKTHKPIYRPYRKPTEYEEGEYDYGEIYATEDDGRIYLDVDNENNYEHQSDERWDGYEILDESAAGREDDRNEFAEWCRMQPNYGFVRGMGWMCSITHEYFTTDFMYELFKQQKEK